MIGLFFEMLSIVPFAIFNIGLLKIVAIKIATIDITIAAFNSRDFPSAWLFEPMLRTA